MFKIEFETFYAQYPPKPKWVQLMMDYISKTKPKRLPVHDLSLHEYFKKFYGTKEAIKCKVSRSTYGIKTMLLPHIDVPKG